MSSGVLFLCVANSARSQMAEGLARARFGTSRLVASAGSEPGQVHPEAVSAMAEQGIDISAHRSKGLEEIDLGRFSTIVTLCADQVCPVVPVHVRRLHWPISDPVRVGTREVFRAARDEIARHIEELEA
jgi:arsenate reductase (thioredoxin)